LVSATEEVENVRQRRLVAVVPVGALGCIGIQVPLIDGGVGCLIVEPFANAVATALQKREWIAFRHVPTT
jgi:hypothetical protein